MATSKWYPYMRTIGQMKIRAYKDNILCINGDFQDTSYPVVVLLLNPIIGKDEGIAPLVRVFEIGPDVDWLEPRTMGVC